MAINSCLVYPGGKRKLADEIMSVLPDGITDWREPFFGGGSVSIAFLQSEKSKDCKTLIAGDLYGEVWAFWFAIQRDVEKVLEYCHLFMDEKCPTHAIASHALAIKSEDAEKLHEQALIEGKAFWDWSQSVDVTTMNIYERAARFFIVNRCSFSAMSDSGTLSKIKFMEFSLNSRTPSIRECAQLLQRIEIINAPFETTMEGVGKNGFVFLDPPYIAQEGSGLYGKDGSTHKGFPHQALADLCRKLDSKWLMTIDDSIAARKLYRGMFIESFKLVYTMAANASDDALAGEEIFISNYKLREDESFDNLLDIL